GESPIIDKWMYALKNLSRLEERPAALRERVFARLFEAAKIAAYTKEERNQYENDMMTENDYRNTIDYARDEGRAEGHAAGLAEGKAEIARRMLSAGLPVNQVTEFTGLSGEQLEKLK
ncbi:MAG TPA: PD-(D/E)XK nuclease family transposase, partial [Candidatus Cryptobacteroides merdipullorum]|nr:PD-(D/E)XK nuclease family transposase [Candidatus Cryptobacteroides merdipullorum]